MYSSGIHPATFVGGSVGPWRVERLVAVCGDSLPSVDRLEVHPGSQASGAGA